jgi:hypothetical protein
MKHWPLLLVGLGVASTALYHSLVVSEIPGPLRGLPIERLPASDEAIYPGFFRSAYPQVYDVKADIGTVRRHLEGYSVHQNPFETGWDLMGPEGTFQVYPGVVWAYDNDPLTPGPPLPTYKGRTIIVATETPGFRTRVRGATRKVWQFFSGKPSKPRQTIGFYLDVDTYWNGTRL